MALLLIYGIGSIIGPTSADLAMASLGPQSLFVTTAAARVVLLGIAAARLRARAGVPLEHRGTFQQTPIARTGTPETATLAAGALREAEEHG